MMFRRAFKLLVFIPFYIREVIASNIRVARDVLRPKPKLTPGIIALPLELKSDYAIALFGNLITMTPGTLSVDVSEDKKILYVHSIYMDNPELLKTQIKSFLEVRLKEIFE